VLVISVSLWIINAIKYFELIWAMFKGMTQYTQTLATYMYTVSFGVQVPIFKLGYGSAISVIMFLIVVVGISVFRKLFDREDLQY
jgi:ABC-type sugar transport system permease subunit